MWKCRWCSFALLVPLVLPCRGEQVVVSQIQVEPRPGQPEYIELFNVTSNPFDIGRWRLTGGIRFDFPDFAADQPKASFLRPFERVVVSAAEPSATRMAYGIPDSVRVFGPWTGKWKHKKDRIALEDKNGLTICRVKFGTSDLWPSPGKGTGRALVLIDPNREVDDWRNWTLASDSSGPPGTPPRVNRTSLVASPEIDANAGQLLLDYGAIWSFNDSGQNLGTGWQQPQFDDGQWRRGPGLLGYDTKPLPKPGLRTRVNFGRQITYYFRCPFSFSGERRAGDRLILDQILDDGAVYYLNGNEVARPRMPDGPVSWTTLSSSTVPTASEEINAFTLDPNFLVKGSNLLAVEVHQCSPSSSDVVFAMRLRLVQAPPPGLVINEVFLDAGGGFVELCNTASSLRNLKGCFVSDQPDHPRQPAFPNDLVLPPGGLAVVDLATAGIRKANPLTIYLTAPDGQSVLNAVTVNGADDGRALGRSPDGGNTWFRFPEPSRGAPNPKLDSSLSSVSRPSPLSSEPTNSKSEVVINEIMYDPPYGAAGTEYIELFNRGQKVMDLSGWAFDQGVSFEFPAGTSLVPDGFVVIAADLARFRKAYGEVGVLGPFEGHLKHHGELLRLVDASGQPVNAVDFRAGGDWPELARGAGSSLELLNPWMDNSRSSAWRDSQEAVKGPWRAFSCTNTYEEANPLGQPTDYRELHLYLVGSGHVALRSIGLFRKGVNYLDHPERMSRDDDSADGWVAQGTHAGSFMTNGELHVVSDGRGDNRADRVEVDCVRVRKGEPYELRFEGRWVSGCPRLIVQTWDRSIGGSFLMEIPSKLGTPGQPNSVSDRLPDLARLSLPQLDDLLHSPAVPRSFEKVRITVRVTGAGPNADVRLMHRPDSADGQAPWSRKPMAPDRSDLEGLYAAELTEYQTNEQVVQFYVQAVGAGGQSVTLPRDGPGRPALYVVDDRKITRDGRIDRFVVSAYDLGSMREGNKAKYHFRQPRLSNHHYNMTFISNEEAIFYGGRIRVSGSPFTRGRDLSKAKWELPADRPFRGRTKFYYDNDSNIHNRLCRYLLYQLGHVANQAEWIHVIINSSGAFLKEDTEPVTSEFLDRAFPDGRHGDLYRFDDEWWFTDDWERNNRDADWSYKGTDDPLHYRTEWQKHTREVEDDYSALFAFFKVYSSNRYSHQQIDQYLDQPAMLQMAAVRGYIGDWDSFTMFRGKNGYFYRRPTDGRFQFLQWDSDLAYRTGNYPFYSDRVASWLERPYNLPVFKRNLSELAQFTESPRFAAWLEMEATAVPERPVTPQFYKNFFHQRNRFLKATGGSVRLQ
jgi:hypothetical protein